MTLLLYLIQKFAQNKRQTDIDLKNCLISIEKMKKEHQEFLNEREELLTMQFSSQKEKLENEVLSKSNELIE